MIKILKNDIKQLNIGEVQGTLYNSFNLNLSLNIGKIGTSPSSILTTDTIGNMTTPVAFIYFDSKWFSVGGRVYVNDGTAIGTFAADASTGAQTNLDSAYADMEVFGTVLMVATTSGLYSKASASGLGTGAYTLRRTCDTTAPSPAHMMTVFSNRLYWIDGPYQIFSMDTSFSTDAVSTGNTYTFLCPTGYKPLWIRSYSKGLYIGCINENGDGVVIEWNGITANTITATYRVYAEAALAGYVFSGTLYVVNSHAELLEFSGSGFKVVGKIPTKDDLLYKATQGVQQDRFIHPNGLTSLKGKICMLINSRQNSTSSVMHNENIHSGIWEYDGTSLYHKTALSYRTDPTSSQAVQDYGQLNLNGVGALVEIPDIFATTDATKGRFFAGASYFTDATTVGYGIWTDNYYDNVIKAGFFETVQIRAQRAQEMWQKIVLLYNSVADMNVVLKYRTTKVDSTEFTITWTGLTTFTTTQTGLSVGDEITITQGKGSGRVAHILSITGTSTFTVTLDEKIILVTLSGTAMARRSNWIKIAPADVTKSFIDIAFNKASSWIQFKVTTQGTGENLLIEEMVLDNKQQI